jgi:ubiquinone/menaquinone biosynthesis C-methylase UbiE
VSDPADRTRHTYDAIGPQFLENARDRSTLAPWLDRFAAALPPAAMVLDLGAGPGVDSADLRRRGLTAISLDFSLGMLRAGVQEFPGPRLQADARRLPLRPAAVQGVWANASLLHLSRADIGVALGEIRRVLGASGLLFVSVKMGTGAEWESDRYGKPRFFQYWSSAELDEALRAAGFSVETAAVDERPRAAWLVRIASLSGNS